MKQSIETDNVLSEDIKLKLKKFGVATYKVTDGEVFVLSKETVVKLLAKCMDTDHVILFVKTGVAN